MQRIREGDIYYSDNHKGMERFADKDAYNLGNPLRESKDTAIIFTALCARAAMDGGLSPRIAKQLEVQYIRAIEQCTDVGLIEVNSAMVSVSYTHLVVMQYTPSNSSTRCLFISSGVMCRFFV